MAAWRWEAKEGSPADDWLVGDEEVESESEGEGVAGKEVMITVVATPSENATVEITVGVSDGVSDTGIMDDEGNIDNGMFEEEGRVDVGDGGWREGEGDVGELVAGDGGGTTPSS
jgi:hypothetical protein